MTSITDFHGYKNIGGIQYITTEPIIWRIGHRYGPEYRVEAGFKFQVSIPWWFEYFFGWWLRLIFGWKISWHNRAYIIMAIIHDHMLKSGLCADAFFYEGYFVKTGQTFYVGDNHERFLYSRFEAAGTAGAILKVMGVGRFERLCAATGMAFWTVK